MTPFSAEVHFHKNPLGSLPVAYKKHAMMFSREPLGPFTKINFLLLLCQIVMQKRKTKMPKQAKARLQKVQNRSPCIKGDCQETTEKITNIITVHRIYSVVHNLYDFIFKEYLSATLVSASLYRIWHDAYKSIPYQYSKMYCVSLASCP